MIYPSILDIKYKEYFPFIQKVSTNVKSTLINFCEKRAGYAFISRIKNIESVAEKIETGRFKKWSDLNDLFACTIIIPTLSHEDEVIKFCKNTFDIIKTIKRGQNKKAPDIFRFDSTRIYGKLKKPDSLNKDNVLSIYSIIFEIQIKSAFEYAWSVSTHDLVYKSSEIDWKKLRLAALIKANVEQLDMLILAFEQTSSIIEENEFPEIKIKNKLAKEINILFQNGKLPEELKPKDMSRLCDNLYRLIDNANKEKNIQEKEQAKNTKKYKEIINQIKDEINPTTIKEIPLSISLFQYLYAILIDKKIIEIPKENHQCHITKELTDLYPNIKIDNASIFLYE